MPKNGSKLDFTWFEYSIERFEEIVSDYMAFWGDFKERHDGFEPTGASQKRVGSSFWSASMCFQLHNATHHHHTGAATYFIQRIPDKPFGWFSQQGQGFDHPGLSFTLDPVYKDPSDPTWELFLKESIAFALAHGGRVALTQTRFVSREDYLKAPGNKPLTDAPNHRFTSAFFERFLPAAGAGADGGEQVAAVLQKKL